MPRIIVDEGVGPATKLWQHLPKHLQRKDIEVIELAKQHPGIPDSVILARVLLPGDTLVTNDRVLHNQAIASGIRSFTLTSSGKLTDKVLRDVPKNPPRIAPPNGDIRDNYCHAPHPISSALRDGMIESESRHHRARRRRIRNQFGGQDNIQALALTIGSHATTRGMLCGFFLKVSGNTRKRLDASEGYGLPADGSRSPALCVVHALVDVYLLDLEDIPIEIFVVPQDSLDLCRALLETDEVPSGDPIAVAARQLLGGIKSVRVQPCGKGFFYEAMERRLGALTHKSTNEVVVVDFATISQKLTKGRSSSDTAKYTLNAERL